jgi:hypothetical protein
MKNISLSIISAALLLVIGSSAVLAEPAGRVLVAVGDTTALRQGSVVRLTRGTEVQSGDTLRVGEASNMQVRFTDEGITALRSNSEFRIDDYKFEGGSNVGKSFVSLLKGGMRSITGLIGRFNRDDYAVRTKAATIGIRGTHFVLAQCAGDCFNRDGSKAEDGLFGGVTDGRIAVSNQTGEKQFGKNEFFHVPSLDAAPKPLLVPPSFLRDQLDGQTKSNKGKTTLAKAAGDAGNGKAKNGEAANGGGETVAVAEGSETSGGTTELQTSTAVTTQPTDGTPVVVQVETQFVPVEQDVVQTDVSGGTINTVATGQAFPYQFSMVNAWAGKNTYTSSGSSGTFLFGWSEAWMDQGSLTVIDSTKLLQAKDILFADFVINQTPFKTFLMDAYSASGTSDYYSYNGECGFDCAGTLDGTTSFTWAKTASTDTGSNTAAANLSWGRFTSSFNETVLTGTYAGNTNNETSYEHWATGDLLDFAALPTSGTYTYSHVGGTRPTDQNGNLGTAVTGGNMSVNFTGAGGATISMAQTTWSMPTTNNSYSLSFNNVPVSITQQSYSYTTSGYTDTGTTTHITLIGVNATCSGACSNYSTPINVTSKISPMLFGASAQGLAAGITTIMPVAGTSPAENTASVQVYVKN